VLRKPDVRQWRTFYRRRELVDRTLWRTFALLVSGRARWPLYLWGDVGAGKTAAALALCDFVPRSKFRTVSELVDATLNRDESWRWEGLASSKTTPLAVLDELATRQVDRDLHYEVVKDFADLRELTGRVAVYVANVEPAALAAHYDDRVADRVLCGTVFELRGESRRHE